MRRRKIGRADAMPVQTVLLAADGLNNRPIAEDISRGHCAGGFAEKRLDGPDDEPRPGNPGQDWGRQIAEGGDHNLMLEWTRRTSYLQRWT